MTKKPIHVMSDLTVELAWITWRCVEGRMLGDAVIACFEDELAHIKLLITEAKEMKTKQETRQCLS